MGIESTDHNQATASGATTGAAPQGTAAPQQNNPHDGKNRNWSFQDRTPFGSAPLARGQGSEYIAKMSNVLVEKFKTAPTAYKYNLLPIDRLIDQQIWFSALVFCMTEAGNDKAVAYHILILEATNVKIPVLTKSFGLPNESAQVEVLRPSSEAYDQDLEKLVRARIRAEYPNAKQYPTQATVVPRDFDMTDPGLVHQLALQISLANSTEFDVNSPDFQDINLGLMINDSRLIIAPSYSKSTITDAVNNPIRADIGVNFSSKRNTAGQSGDAGVNAGENNSMISQLTGFIDFMYSPVLAPDAGLGGYQPQLPPGVIPTQTYAPRLVITSMQNYFATTLSGQLLSLLTSLSASENGNWMQSFLPNSRVVDGKPFLMHNIGGLGIETIGGGKPVDTLSDSFRPEDLGKFITAVVREGLTLSMDVPDCSPDSWALGVFSAAAKDSVPAINAILGAAAYLSNGAFTRHFNTTMPMFVDKGNRVHLGYYRTKEGLRRDIRDIDYLAVANTIGEKDPRVIREWSDTFAQVNIPLIPRLASRKKIIENIQPSVEFTGFAHRVTFSSQFMVALATACREAGFAPTLAAQFGTAGMHNQRGVNNFINDAAIGTHNNVFQQPSSGWGSGPTNFGYHGARF